MTTLCQFRFLCDRRWNDLAAITDQPDGRYCDGCAKQVFRCADYDELAGHLAQQYCVAMAASRPGVMLIGDPAPGRYGRKNVDGQAKAFEGKSKSAQLRHQ